MSLPIYLDYAASTPVATEVVDAMTAALRSPALQANPSAGTHAAGRQAAVVVELARAQVAGLIGADPDEVIFTSGATEADNLAIIGGARFREAQGRHLVTALTEHKAVIESVRYLARQGWRVTWLKPDAGGRIGGHGGALLGARHGGLSCGVGSSSGGLVRVCCSGQQFAGASRSRWRR